MNDKFVEVAVVRSTAFEVVLGDPVEPFGHEFAKEVVHSSAVFADIPVARRHQLVVAGRDSLEAIGRSFHAEVDIAAEDNRLERYAFLVPARQNVDRLAAENQTHL